MAAGDYASQDDLLRDALAALAERKGDLASIQAGISDMETGRARPLEEVSDAIRRKHGWSSPQ